MKRIKFGKCPQWKRCRLYDGDNKICNEEAGFYGSKQSSCLRRLNNEKR